MFVLAHLSDPHLAPLPAPRFSDLASKRLFGFLNWQRSRRDIHRSETLEALVADVKAQSPDHIAITGDLINLALPEEFTAGRAWLKAFGDPERVSVVAGNHDSYVRGMADEPLAKWGAYMTGDAPKADAEPAFPFVRKRGAVALIGVSSAVATAPMQATGRVGDAQIKRLGDTLRQLGAEGMFRIVMIHHPPTEGGHHHNERLIDARPLLTAIEQNGAELLLHGHNHIRSVAWLDAPGRRIPAVGVPSASAAAGGDWEAGGYNLYRVEGAQGAWQCEAVARGIKDNGEIVELDRRMLVRD